MLFFREVVYMKKISFVLSIILILLSIVPVGAANEIIYQNSTDYSQPTTDTLESIETIPENDISISSATKETSEATQPSEIKSFVEPQILSIEKVTNGIKLIWDSQEGAYSYRLFYKHGDSWKAIVTTKNTSYIYNATLGTKYIYTVRIVNPDGSWGSPYKKAGWTYTRYLNTPALQTVKYGFKTTTEITWKPVNQAKKYQIFYKRRGWDYWKSLARTTQTMYTDSGCKNGITYIYTVRVIDEKTNAFISDYNHDGIVIEYHNIPKLISVSGETSGINFTWEKVPGVDYYKVYYKDNGSSWKEYSNNPVNSNSVVIPNMVPGHKYTFTVKCSNVANQLRSFHDTTGTTLVYAAQPQITKATRDCSDITISWNKCSGATKYKIFFYNYSTKHWITIGTTDKTTFTYSDAYCDGYNDTKGGIYCFTVRCLDKYNTYNSGYNKNGYDLNYDFTPIKQKVQLKCPYYSQNVMGAGCETYATTMLLNFYGWNIQPTTFADEYLLQKPVSYYDGDLHGPSMDSAFAGTVYGGYGINARGMAKCINDYLSDLGSKYRAYPSTEKSLQYLCNKYVANGIPVLVWSTSQLTETWVEARWKVNYTNGGDTKTDEEWYRGEHCLVLIGYDFPNRRYIYNDSLALDREVGVSNWAKVRSEDRFDTLGRNSIVLLKK